MANELRLKVQINDAETLKSLQMIDDLASEISKQPYKLKVQVEGADKVSKEMISLAKAQTQLKKAEVDLEKQRAKSINATASLTRAQNELAVSHEKTKQAVEKTQQTWVSSAAKVAAAEEKTKQATEKTAQAQQKTQQEIEKTARHVNSLNSAAQTFLGTLSAWAASRAISFVKQQLAEALDTLREVDQEMVNVRKVSDFSDRELAAIRSGAYDTASKYGIGVTSYLSSIAEWAKAGYDNADALAELSTKLELVGDVSSSVATQMLLSADAAWKYKGNISDLSLVIDEANVIENNFATSIDKIAEGFPIVASVASMAGMSVEETMAAIGTITASTQESGRKAATALRAIILNLMKETGSFEDGVEVTTESIDNLYAMLRRYEPAALEAAEATGKIVDPMKAVSALSQAFKDGLMTEAELAVYISGLGGKLRTNQLNALIQGQDMYNEMLALVENAAGSADKEAEIMADSWTANLKRVKNSWTELVDVIHGSEVALASLKLMNDTLQNTIFLFERLDKVDKNNPLGRSTDAKLWDEATLKLYKEYSNKLHLNHQSIAEFATSHHDAIKAEVEHRKELRDLNKVAERTLDRFKELAAPIIENSKNMEENAQSAKDDASAILSAADAKKLFDEAMKADEKDDPFKDYAAAFRTLQAEIDAGRVNSNAFWASAEFLFGAENLEAMDRNAEKIATHAAEIAPMFEDADSAGKGLLSTMEQYANTNGDIVDSTGNLVAHIESLAGGGWNWFVKDADKLASILGVDVNAIVSMQEAMGVFSDVSVTGSQEAASAAEDAKGALEQVAETSMAHLVSEINRVSDALDRAAGKATGLTSALRNGTTITPFATGTSGAPGGPALVNDGNGPELIADRGSAYIAGGGRPTIVNLSRGARVFTAEQTRSILGSARGGRIPAYDKGVGNNTADVSIKDGEKKGRSSGLFSPVMNYTPGSDKGGGGGYTAAAVTAPDMKEAQSLLDDLLKNLDQQAKLAKNEGRYGDMNALYQQAQDEIQKVVDQYLAQGYEETSTEVVTLKNKIFDYAGKMEDLAAKAWKDLESQLSDTLKNLDQQAKLYENQGDTAGANSVYQQAQKEIQTLIDRYLEAGYSETSDEVVKLTNKLYDYADKVVDLEKAAWEELEDALDAALDEIDKQITLAKHQGDTAKILELYGQAQGLIEDRINQYLAAGYSPDSPEIVALANRGYGYAESQTGTVDNLWQTLIQAIEGLKDATEDANDLAEKQLAVEEAAKAYENAKSQRTVRIYNPKTGQWEWIADDAAMQNARKNLESAQSALQEKELSQALAEIKKGGMGAGGILASPYLAANYSGAGADAQMAFLAALGAWSGAVDRTGSAAATSMFQSSDSHDNNTNYTIGGVTLTKEQAQGMTLADLAAYLGYADLAG